MKQIKIRQTNLNNKAVKNGKFYPKSETFFGISAYTNHNTKEVINRLKNGETSFIVTAGITGEAKILYEVI